MAEPWLSTVEKLTEFFSTDQIEASARRTKFVQRASKITGKLFLALVTFGRWSAAKTTVPQLAAKAAQLDVPVEITPEALQQRMSVRAVAFWQDLLQTAFAKLHTGDTICEEGMFAPFPRVYIADSTGFGLPASLARKFQGREGVTVQRGVICYNFLVRKTLTLNTLFLIIVALLALAIVTFSSKPCPAEEDTVQKPFVPTQADQPISGGGGAEGAE